MEIFLYLVLEYLSIGHCFSDNIFPGAVDAQPFSITKYDTQVLCSRKAHINAACISNKPNRFSLVLFGSLIPLAKPGTDSTKDNHFLFSTLKRVNGLNFAFFVLDPHKRLDIGDLLAVRRDYADVMIRF